MNTTQNLRNQFDTMIDSRTLDQATSDLILVNASTTEGMMIRTGIINSIEKRYPAIAEWVRDFWDDEANDDIDYPEAILIARASLNI